MADMNGGGGSMRQRTSMMFNTMEKGGHSDHHGKGESLYYNTETPAFSVDDGLTAEFRHRIGLLPEEEQDLSDAFKTRIGLSTAPADDEIVQEVSEVEMPVDIETESTLSRHRFSKFVKTHINPAALPQDGRMYSNEPHRVPLLAKEREIDKTASVVVSIAIKRFCRDIPVPTNRPSIYSTGNPVMSVLYYTLDALKRRRLVSPQCAIAHTHSSKSSSISRNNSTDMGTRPLPDVPGITSGGDTQRVKPPPEKKGTIRRIFGGGSVKSSSGKSSSSRKGSDPHSPTSEEVPPNAVVSRRKSSESSSVVGLTRSQSVNIDETQEFADLARIMPVDDLDLVQFIIGLGILRKDLRDEIYCQLSFQVAPGNKSTESAHKGWALHALCAGCFMPSQELLQYYFSFLHDTASNPSAPFKEYAAQAKNLLHRTSTYGLRYHPPNFIEYQAVLTQKKVMLPVTMPDGSIQTMEADAATTASQISNKISDEIGLKDQFGFAVYISIFDKVSSLGNGSDHVMDAISECEQLVRTAGGLEESAPWKLYFRKEIYTPWHDASFDPVSTRLIYQQIVRSVQAEEFRMRCEEEIVRFVSRRWYIERSCGPMGLASGERDEPLTVTRIVPVIHEYLPRALLVGGKSRDSWAQLIASTYEQMGFTECKFSRTAIKESVVESATRKWPLQFSGLFEAYRVGGPPLPTNRVVLAVGCRGIFFLQEPYHIMMGLHYYEIVDVAFHPAPVDGHGSSGQAYGRSLSSAAEGIVKQYAEPGGKEAVTIITIAGIQWTFVSPNAETVSRLLGTFLDGLRRRSRWAVAIQEFVLEDNSRQESGPSTFNLRQGDVVELMDETKQTGLKEDWMYGRSLTTGQAGGFPFDCVYIFPTCSKPPDEFLAVFSQMSRTDATRLPRKRGALLLAKDGATEQTGHSDHSAI